MLDIETLVTAFKRAGEMLKRLVLSMLSDASAQMNRTTREIGRIVDSLKGLIARWVTGNAPKAYIAGHRQAGGDAGRPEDLDARLRASLDVQIVSLTSRLLSASEAMREDSLGKLRHAAHLRLQGVMLGEQGIGKAGSEFREDVEAEGVTLKDRQGRKIQPESYCRMALRTTSGTLLNNGTLETAAQLGAPGVRVFDGTDVDDECREANGQAWSVAYAMANPLQHPHCTRSFALLTSSFSGELDRT